jgi:hypothetical protein
VNTDIKCMFQLQYSVPDTKFNSLKTPFLETDMICDKSFSFVAEYEETVGSRGIERKHISLSCRPLYDILVNFRKHATADLQTTPLQYPVSLSPPLAGLSAATFTFSLHVRFGL